MRNQQETHTNPTFVHLECCESPVCLHLVLLFQYLLSLLLMMDSNSNAMESKEFVAGLG